VTAKPPDFEPLSSSDPVPADTGEIAQLGKRYTDTAAEIVRQAGNLRRLASGTPEGWKSQAGAVFASHASSLATRISEAHARYATAGQALTTSVEPMYDAQQRAYAAVWQAKDATEQMTANQPLPARPPGSSPPTAEEKAASNARQNRYEDAQTTLTAAQGRFAIAVADYQQAASGAANTIRNQISHDGLKDSWWESHFGWVSTFFKVLAIVVIVLAIVALIIACPFTAGLLAALPFITSAGLATAGAALGWALAGATVLQAVYDGIEASDGKESWTAFDMDIVALVTFGFGKGAEAVAEVLADFSESAGKAVVAGRAGRAAMRLEGLPGFLYSLASRSSLIKSFVDADAFANATAAAQHATQVVEAAVKAAEPGNLPVLMTMSSDLAKTLAKFGALSDEVPGVVRIAAPRAIVQGLAAVEGFAQWASFLGGGAFTFHSLTTSGQHS
jgi:hypothetical protein